MANIVLYLCSMWISLTTVALLMGCIPTATDPDGPAPIDPPSGTRSTFHDCRGRTFEPAARTGWRHDVRTPIVTAAGAPNHAGRDLVVTGSRDATLVGTFAYGLIAKDLEDEDIRVSLDDCTGWQTLGDFATDDDGEIHVTVTQSLDVGAYDVRFQVLGDGSTTAATLWVLPVGTHLVITDIDGTLTTSDSELFEQILDGSNVPVAYAGSAELLGAHADRGQIVMYLTGRPDWLMAKTRAWLGDLGFAGGPLRLADSNSQILPTQSSVGDFKKSAISQLRASGYVIDAAYGNASTDVYAYLGAGIAADDVWIVGTHGGEQGTHAATDWTVRAAEVAAGSTVIQPFD